ncbi:unnamed protein product, partial [Hapterophycus canaliculatus]
SGVTGEVAGVISCAGALIKEGTGTLALSGENTYSGDTTVAVGTLSVISTTGSAIGTGNVTVGTGATLVGDGTLTGSVTANDGGYVMPGTGPEILTTGGLSLNAGSTLAIEIASTAGPGVAIGHDQLAVVGTVDLTGAILELTDTHTPSGAETFTVINNDDADAIVGTFAELAEGATVTAGGNAYQISYVGGDGNDVVLTGGQVVSVAVTPGSVDEDDTENLVYTLTRTGTTGALTVDFTVAGTATFSDDYTQAGASIFNSTTGSVTFADGRATATVSVNPVVDGNVEPDETVVLTLVDGVAYDLAVMSDASGTITNDDSAVVTLSPAIATVDEGDEGTTTTLTFDVTVDNRVDGE